MIQSGSSLGSIYYHANWVGKPGFLPGPGQIRLN